MVLPCHLQLEEISYLVHVCLLAHSRLPLIPEATHVGTLPSAPSALLAPGIILQALGYPRRLLGTMLLLPTETCLRQHPGTEGSWPQGLCASPVQNPCLQHPAGPTDPAPVCTTLGNGSWFEDIGLISVYLSFCRINFYPVATDVLHAFMITNSSIHLGCKNLSVMDLNLLYKCNRKEVPVWRVLIQCSLCNQLANELISLKTYIKSFPVEIIF